MLPFRAAYKIHTMFQNMWPMPYAVDYPNFEVVQSKLHQNVFHKTIRITIFLIFFVFFIPTLILRITWLCFHWNSFTVNHIDQFVVYLLYLTVTFIFLAASFTQHKHTFEIEYISNQLYKLVQELPENVPSSFLVNVVIPLPRGGETTNIIELLICSLSTSCYNALLGLFLLPFAISYEPVQFVIGNFSVLAKLFSSAVYFIIMNFLVATILSSLLVVFVVNEGVLRYSSAIRFHKTVLNVSPRLAFLSCFKRVRTMQVLLILCNHIESEFLSLLLFIGVFLGSVGAYMTLKMYSMLNIFIYMLAPAITTICFGIAIFLTYLSSFPYKNSKYFKVYWKSVVVGKKERMMINACKPIGFNLGPYGTATSKLGLLICDDIIRNTVTMLLMG